jgi:hypothetical protein
VDLLLGAPAKDWNSHLGAIAQAEEEAKKAANARRQRERNPSEKPSRPLPEYCGIYEHPAYGECRVDFADGQLHWHWSSFHLVMEHYRHDTFELKNIDLNDPLIEFVVEANEVRSMKFMEMVFVKRRQSKDG